MRRYNPKQWADKKEDERLELQYGENWKLIKRFRKRNTEKWQVQSKVVRKRPKQTD